MKTTTKILAWTIVVIMIAVAVLGVLLVLGDNNKWWGFVYPCLGIIILMADVVFFMYVRNNWNWSKTKEEIRRQWLEEE